VNGAVKDVDMPRLKQTSNPITMTTGVSEVGALGMVLIAGG